MPTFFTSPRISFPLALLALLTTPSGGQAQSASAFHWSRMGNSQILEASAASIHPKHKASRSKSITGNLEAEITPVEQAEEQSPNPVRANLNALNALKAGQPNHSLLALSLAQQVLFQDDFSHPDSMAQRWSWSTNDGALIYQNHCLELSAKGYRFPVIQTVNDPFPATGDWTVSIGYKYTGETVCGTDLKIARLDGSNLPDLAFVHEDNNGQFLSIDGAGQVWRQSPNQNWHVLTLCKQGSRIKTIMDGSVVAQSDAGVAPVGLRFGNSGSVTWDATWTSQQIGFVQVAAPREAVAAIPRQAKPNKAPMLTKLAAQHLSSPAAWTTQDGSQFLEASDTAAHLKPRVDGKGPRTVTATCKLTASDTKVWQVAAEIRFGNLQDQASSFHLTREGQDIGWIGADGFNKGIGVFTGKDNNVLGLTADAVWHRLSYKSDGNSLIVTLDGKQARTATAQASPDALSLSNSQDMSLPCHQEGVWVRNISFQSGASPSLPEHPSVLAAAQPAAVAPVSLPPPPRPATTIDLAQGDDNICCVLGDTLHLFGQSSGKHRQARHAFEVNGQPYTDLPVGPDENGYSFTWKPNAPGTYHLAVKYTLEQPYDVVKVKEATLIISPKIPAALNQLDQSVPTDVPANVQPLDTSVFRPARVEFSLDGQPAGAAAQAPFQAMLPVSKLAPGQHSLTYRAYDAQGLRYQGETQTITVPERIILALPSSLTITAEKETTPLSVQLTPGLKVVQVNYFVGDQQVASSAQAPYNASADLAPFRSGAYDLKAQAVTSDFGVFSSLTLHLNLTNHPDDDRLTRLAKEEADQQAILLKAEEKKQAKLAKQVEDAAAAKAEQERVIKEIEANKAYFWPRPGFDEKIFRKQAAELAYYAPEKRYGEVGKVHGLCVLVETMDGEKVSEIGKPLTISASVRSGTGQTNFLAFSKDDARITAQQAAEYCKTKTAYYHWDWSKYDLTVGYLENDVISSGPSAGAADALAMMSAILNIRVDSSVALTGAITLQGQVEPVGGVGLKAKSAFGNTDAHTLVFPPDIDSLIDLFYLYKTNPKLCFPRRVVMARTMDDVIGQALIGWDSDSEIREEKLVQGGLRHFARGEDKQALAAFAAAKGITPGNWTINFWTSMIYAVEKQSREDAADGLK